MADPTNPAAPPLSPEQQQMLGLQPDTSTMGKITNFIGNPLVSGALGAYLGTISQPRYEGWGHALATGGLEGLGAFNQARAYQANLPLIRARTLEGIAGIGQKQAQAQKATSGAALDTQRTADLKAANDAKAQMLKQIDDPKDPVFGTMDPNLKAVFRQEVASGAHPNPEQYGFTPKAKADTRKANIEADKAKYEETTLLPAEVRQHEAEAGAAGAAATQHIAEANKANRDPAVKPQFEVMVDSKDGHAVSVDKTKPLPPGVVPATVYNKTLSDADGKAKMAVWQKAYQLALTAYQKSNTHWYGQPSFEEADAVARSKADQAVAMQAGGPSLGGGPSPVSPGAATGTGSPAEDFAAKHGF